MPTFSERMGYKPVRTVIQKESADEELRNSLWNGLLFLLDPEDYYTYEALLKSVWLQYFKRRIDEIPRNDRIVLEIKKIFIFGEWYEMYDLLEFIPAHYEEQFGNKKLQFLEYANNILKKCLSAYRFIDNQIVEITSELEIDSIENALNVTQTKYRTVHAHLKRALELLSDRTSPDYRNSIKESISSVESISCIITKNPKSTLGQALKEIDKNHQLHASLKGSFEKLYGYSSDADGIRHALLEESNLSKEDALFMLVTCSAFVNYLIIKSDKIN